MRPTTFNTSMKSVLIICTILIIVNKCSGSSSEVGIIYSCCHIQNTFEDKGYCPNTCAVSEFDSSFSTTFLVPEPLNGNGSSFDLTVETRNTSVTGVCATSFRVPITLSPKARSSVQKGTTIPVPTFYTNGFMSYNGVIYAPSQYCLDSLSDGENIALDVVVLGSNCIPSGVNFVKKSHSHGRLYSQTWINHLFAGVSGLSFLFSVLNVIIYLSLRNYLNTSGWVEFAYFLALAVFSAFSVAAFLHHPSGFNILSYVTSVVLQFAEIMISSSFLAIAFDVYWMLRKSENSGTYGEEVEESKLRLVVYYIFLLVIPIGTTTYGIVINQESMISAENSTQAIPNYGEGSCFAPVWPVTEYLSFILSSAAFLVILISIKRILKLLSASADVDDAPRVSLLSNMFFFTLLYWIMDLLKFSRPFLSQNKELDEESSSQPVWILMNAFTYAQGVMSSLVFIFNRKTLKAFRKKSGSDGTLREIFRHACCSSRNRVKSTEEEHGATPMSPLMKSSGMKRSTVKQNHDY